MKSYTSVQSDHDYHGFEKTVSKMVSMKHEGPIFTTDAEGLWQAYLEHLPSDRQHYNCVNCRRFIERFGGLAQIDAGGRLSSLLWGTAAWPGFFDMSVESMMVLVWNAKITGVFINDQKVWGNPQTGVWTHLSGTPLDVWDSKVMTASQVMAEKTQDFGILKHGLADFDLNVAEMAVRILEADALDRSEKTLGIAKWFLKLHLDIGGLRGTRRDNIIWRAVGTAPPGWCHVRSSMISTLLQDIKDGLGFAEINARWTKKMHPLQYQRPTASITGGQIQAGNKRIEELGAAASLPRRFAQLEEVTSFWKPSPIREQVQQKGVFDHLIRKNPCKDIELPTQLMTWARFKDEILPQACKLELLAPMHGAYFGMVTAVNLDAPPLLQWDTDPRNPVSWFFYHNGSSAFKWSLSGGAWVEINALCWKPPHWHHPDLFRHEGEAVFLILEGAKLRDPQPGGSFFPESLRAEFREVRAAMEAYSNTATVAESGTANGYALQNGTTFNVTVRVNGDQTYKLDRWS